MSGFEQLDEAEELIIGVLTNISKSTELVCKNLGEVEHDGNGNSSSRSVKNMSDNVNGINDLTLKIVTDIKKVGTILKENKHVLFPLEDYTNRNTNVKM